MGRYILKRLGISIAVVFLVSVISFTLVHMLPGDPAVLALGSEASEQDIATFREKYYLNRPVVEQYFIWISDTLRGDLGDSITYSRPVLTCLAERLPRTISIGLPALILSSLLGILCGIISAIRRGKFIDNLITFISTIGLGAPQFWLGIVGIYIFEAWLAAAVRLCSAYRKLWSIYFLWRYADPDFVIQPAGIGGPSDTVQYAGGN